MATWNLYIPSQSGSYSTPAGEIQLILTFEGSGAGGNVDFDSQAWFASKLKFDFTMQNDGKVRLGTVKLGFDNHSNIWETWNSVGVFATADDPEKIYLTIKRNSVTFFDGIIDYQNVEKDEYWDASGSLQYSKLVIPFTDKVRALEFYSLADVGISSGDHLGTILSTMASALDLTVASGQFTFSFTEIGGRQYNHSGTGIADPLRMEIADTSVNCLSYLKDLARGFGFLFYTMGGNLYIQSRDTATSGVLDPISDEYRIRKIQRPQTTRYIAVIASRDFSNLLGEDEPELNLPKDVTVRFSVGDDSAAERQNFVLDCTDILQNVYGDIPTTGNDVAPSSTHQPSAQADPSSRPGEIEITNAIGAPDYDASEYEVESGMIVFVNYGLFFRTESFFSITTHWESPANKCYFHANEHSAIDVSTSLYSFVIRKELPQFPSYTKLYKFYACAKVLAEIYAKELLGKKALRVWYTDFGTAAGGFTFNSELYANRIVVYDFGTGEMMVDAWQLESSASVNSVQTIRDAGVLVQAVDDGENKVTAKQLRSHITAAADHIQKSYEGASYLELVDTDKKVHYVHIKKVNGRKGLFLSDEKPR